MYANMRARVTERISKKLGILKHCPCTVVGWELHSADKSESSDTAERLLQYMPRCIYLKFDGAKWQIHKELQPGVFPLMPRKLTWVLNQKTGTKVSRKGFTLLPDYASTAHMVQGMTLPGAMADCGDVLETPALKDMLAAYVALSRVRTAVCLLLLRAFPRRLFQHGATSWAALPHEAAPGQVCAGGTGHLH